MKKIYLSPSIKIASPNFNAILVTTSINHNGEAEEGEGGDAKTRMDADADGSGFYQGYEQW